MDGLCLRAGAFLEALRRATGRRGQQYREAGRLVHRQQGPDQGGLSDAGTAGDDHGPRAKSDVDGLPLCRGERDAALRLGECDSLARVDAGPARLPIAERRQRQRDPRLAAMQRRVEQETAAVHLLCHDHPRCTGCGDGFVDEGRRYAEELRGLCPRVIDGDTAVALPTCRLHDMLQPGQDAEGGGDVVPQPPRERIRDAESDPADVERELIRVLTEGRHGPIAVLLVDVERARTGQAVLREKHHEVADAALGVPTLFDLRQFLLADAGEVEQPGRLLIHDLEQVSAEAFDQTLRQRRADPLHVSGREIRLDAFAAGRHDDRDGFGGELPSPFLVLTPRPRGDDRLALLNRGKAPDDRELLVRLFVDRDQNGEPRLGVMKPDAQDRGLNGLRHAMEAIVMAPHPGRLRGQVETRTRDKLN